eukprot:TRINITY_DN11650_c0_g1_i1.p1 TRINITY_DN11650_c0_g1~~TRINITY_DN11650_c0_g1_i1.p1  ORF type:complete len:596 (+),score=103.26 TRINITY_DN11650_c0_g1_i1:353-2140(+)
MPAFKLATVSAEIDPAEILGEFENWQSLAGCPQPSAEAVARSSVVAQMPTEPIMQALHHGADVVLCGRAYDPACFAAAALLAGIDPALSVHAGKVLECGAIACEPGSGADCLVAEFSEGSALFWCPNSDRKVTKRSVAAHTLYEKSHSSSFGVPGGVLMTSGSEFTPTEVVSLDGNTITAVELKGSEMMKRAQTVKVEGAAVEGHRAVSVTWCDVLAEAAASIRVQEAHGQSSVALYGRDGVMALEVDTDAGDVEAGVLMQVDGTDQESVAAVLAAVRSGLLHCGYPGRKCTAGNLAFPLSPSDVLWETLPGEWRGMSVAGCREPSFIAQWADIKHIALQTARQSVPEAFEAVHVSLACTGKEGAPEGLYFAQTVSTTSAEEALVKHLEFLHAAGVQDRESEVQPVPAGVASKFTLQHLAPINSERMSRWFPISMVQFAGCVVDPQLWKPCELDPIEYQLTEEDRQHERPLDLVLDELSECHLDVGLAARVHGLLGGAKVVRSKNSGITEITYDVIFEDHCSFQRAKESNMFAMSSVAAHLKIPTHQVVGTYFDSHALAIKVTVRRSCLAGDFQDKDVYGSQQHGPLLRLFSTAN